MVENRFLFNFLLSRSYEFVIHSIIKLPIVIQMVLSVNFLDFVFKQKSAWTNWHLTWLKVQRIYSRIKGG